jgi:hypothetical protein
MATLDDDLSDLAEHYGFGSVEEYIRATTPRPLDNVPRIDCGITAFSDAELRARDLCAACRRWLRGRA